MIGTGDAWHTVGLSMAGLALWGHGCACAVVAEPGPALRRRCGRDGARLARRGGGHQGGWLHVGGDLFNLEGWER